MISLRQLIARYQIEGADSFTHEFDDLFRQACKDGASESLKHFVADIALDLQRWEKGLEILKFLQRKSQVSDVLFNRIAFAHWNMGDEMAAIEAYRESLALNSLNISSLRGICILLNQNERDTEARQFAQRWIKLAPVDSEAIEYFQAITENCK